MAETTIDAIVQDALLVAAYGQRCGRFKDAALFEAIQKVKAQPSAAWGDVSVVDLQRALNAAVPQISPVTLVDLKTWNPFGPQNKRRFSAANWIRITFVATTILLIFICGYYTIWYKRASALLAEFSAVRMEQQAAIVNEVFMRLVENDRAIGGPVGEGAAAVEASIAKDSGGIADDTMLSRVAIREKINELRSFDNAMVNRKQRYNELIVDWVPGTSTYYYVRSWFTKPQSAYLEGSGCPTPPFGGPPVPGMVPDEKTMSSLPRFAGYVRDYDNFLISIRCVVKLRAPLDIATSDSNQSIVADLTQKCEVVGLWLLPALYGALGAVMFYMRTFVSPLFPDPPIARVCLRLALGVFAGIAVVWFWLPTVGDPTGPEKLTLGILSLAFLFGFSIDVLFALLDRLVLMANGAISRLGTS